VKRSEWVEVVKRVAAWWPNNAWPRESVAAYFDDLAEVDGRDVQAAVEAIYREGNPFPPNGAQILAAVQKADSPRADWSRGWELANANVHGYIGEPGTEGEPQRALEWLRERDPIAAETVRRWPLSEFGFRRVNETTRAQFRQIYEQVAVEHREGRIRTEIEERSGRPKQLGGAVAAIRESR
jgi:hypothetical protein